MQKKQGGKFSLSSPLTLLALGLFGAPQYWGGGGSKGPPLVFSDMYVVWF